MKITMCKLSTYEHIVQEHNVAYESNVPQCYRCVHSLIIVELKTVIVVFLRYRAMYQASLTEMKLQAEALALYD